MVSQPEQPPVNLVQLRSLTEGDAELEKNLFELFYVSSEENLNYLENNCLDGNNAQWEQNAHSLKGAAKNIGAETLGELCSQAQNSNIVVAEEKRAIAQQIRDEYDRVKVFLQTLYK